MVFTPEVGPRGLKSWRPSNLGSAVTELGPLYPPTFTPIHLPHRRQSTPFGEKQDKRLKDPAPQGRRVRTLV